jgi:ferredoxin/flavodoxin---NADP+ reductase
LLSDIGRLGKTDIADHALEVLRESRVRRVHLIGRRGPLQASFTTQELRELLSLPNVKMIVDSETLKLNVEERDFLEIPCNAVLKRNLAAFTGASGHRSRAEADRELHLHFFASPTRINGLERVDSIEFVRNRLIGSPDRAVALPTERRFSIEAGLIISSIGFRGRPLEGAPFDASRGIIPNIDGRVISDEEGAPLYVVGWIKRGAVGIIGTNRADAAETVRTLLFDLQRRSSGGRSGRKHVGLQHSTDFEDWKAIDEVECTVGKEVGRPRRKVVSIDAMVEIAIRSRRSRQNDPTGTNMLCS